MFLRSHLGNRAVMTNGPANDEKTTELRPLTYDEQVFVAAFKDAANKALDSTDAACGVILTACFSIVTAYGAAVALVAPKDKQSVVSVLLPFIFLGAAAVVALVGKAKGVSLKTVATAPETRSRISDAVGFKRVSSWISIALATAGIIIAGLVLNAAYGHPTTASTMNQEVFFLNTTQDLLKQACGASVASVVGTITSTEGLTTITLASPADCQNTSKLTIPTASIAFTRQTATSTEAG